MKSQRCLYAGKRFDRGSGLLSWIAKILRGKGPPEAQVGAKPPPPMGRAQAGASAKVPPRGAFLATMSHELRTPINAIVGYAELLLSPQVENGPPQKRLEYTRLILRSSRELQSLVDDVLDATRVQNGTLALKDQEHDFAELTEMVVRSMHDLAEANGINIVARLVPGIIVTGDPLRLRQVVRNLLSNAIKFSPNGGDVNIEMQRSYAGKLILAIRDPGIGISAQDLNRVFEPFVQVDHGPTRRFGGLGVGLSLAKHIAELHGGSITLTSEPGKGTEARLILPDTRITWPADRKPTVA